MWDPHEYTYDLLADFRDSYNLSCRRSSGRIARHNSSTASSPRHFIMLAFLLSSYRQVYHALTKNVLINRSLPLAKLEKNATWGGTTVTDTFATSYHNYASETACSAAEQALARKEEKYAAFAARLMLSK